MRNEIVLDLETKDAPQRWEGRDLASLGISVVGIWSGLDASFKVFREGDVSSGLGPLLKNADRIIGFFVTKFDFPVLQPYLNFDLAEIPVLDIFDDVTAKLGHRVSLASLAKATLGAGKLGHGLEAVEWYKQGEWKRLEEYCIQDVRLTRDLYEFGNKFGHLLFESFVDGKVVSVPVAWGMPEETEIRKLLERAQAEGRSLEIDYVSRQNSGDGFLKTRKIEIQAIRGEEIDAYDHLRGEVRMFRIGRIFKARILDEPIQKWMVTQSLFTPTP